jgi:transposase
MITIEFSPEDIDALETARFEHPDKYVCRRMEMVYLKSQGLAHGEIQRLMRVKGNTLRRSLNLYQQGGLAALQERHPYRPQSELATHREPLQAHFAAHPPATVKVAQAQIQELTGLKRSPTQVAHFLKGLGLKCRKVGMIPAKGDPEKQAEYLKKNSSRDWTKPRPAPGRCSLWMPPTLSLGPS